MSHPVLTGLQSENPRERRAACLRAAEDPSAVLLIDALVAALGDSVKAVGRAASDALAAIGRESSEVQTGLRRALQSEDPRLRYGAAFTASRLSPPGPALLPALVEAMGSQDGDVRWSAARILVESGRIHGEVLSAVLGLVRAGESSRVRRMAAFALRELAPEQPATARALLGATGDPDLHVRRAATSALAALIGPPPEVLDHLVAAVAGDPDPACRRIAAAVLGELGAADPKGFPRAAIVALQEADAQSHDESLSRAASRSLGRLASG